MPTILAVNEDASQIAARLLAAAGDQPDRVQVVTGGKYVGFTVDDELARAAGYVVDAEVVDLDATPLLIDETPTVPTEYTEVPLPDPAAPWVEPVAAPTPTADVADGQAEGEPATVEPIVEEPAPVEPIEEPKPVAEKPARKSSRSKQA